MSVNPVPLVVLDVPRQASMRRILVSGCLKRSTNPLQPNQRRGRIPDLGPVGRRRPFWCRSVLRSLPGSNTETRPPRFVAVTVQPCGQEPVPSSRTQELMSPNSSSLGRTWLSPKRSGTDAVAAFSPTEAHRVAQRTHTTDLSHGGTINGTGVVAQLLIDNGIQVFPETQLEQADQFIRKESA